MGWHGTAKSTALFYHIFEDTQERDFQDWLLQKVAKTEAQECWKPEGMAFQGLMAMCVFLWLCYLNIPRGFSSSLCFEVGPWLQNDFTVVSGYCARPCLCIGATPKICNGLQVTWPWLKGPPLWTCSPHPRDAGSHYLNFLLLLGRRLGLPVSVELTPCLLPIPQAKVFRSSAHHFTPESDDAWDPGHNQQIQTKLVIKGKMQWSFKKLVAT